MGSGHLSSDMWAITLTSPDCSRTRVSASSELQTQPVCCSHTTSSRDYSLVTHRSLKPLSSGFARGWVLTEKGDTTPALREYATYSASLTQELNLRESSLKVYCGESLNNSSDCHWVIFKNPFPQLQCSSTFSRAPMSSSTQTKARFAS